MTRSLTLAALCGFSALCVVPAFAANPASDESPRFEQGDAAPEVQGDYVGTVDINGSSFEEYQDDQGQRTLVNPAQGVRVNRKGVYFWKKQADFISSQGMFTLGMGWNYIRITNPQKVMLYQQNGQTGQFAQIYDNDPNAVTHYQHNVGEANFFLQFTPTFYRHIHATASWDAPVTGGEDDSGTVVITKGVVSAVTGERRSFLARELEKPQYSFDVQHDVWVTRATAFAAGFFYSRFETDNYAGIAPQNYGVGYNEKGVAVSVRRWTSGDDGPSAAYGMTAYIGPSTVKIGVNFGLNFLHRGQ